MVVVTEINISAKEYAFVTH